MQAVQLGSIDDTRRLAEALAAEVGEGDMILLDGELGAGKTTLVRALVAALGGDSAQVASPTFTLLNQYRGRLDIFHVDAYRLDGPGGLAALGFMELAERGLGLIEWADRVVAALDPPQCWKIRLEHAVTGRRAFIEGPAERGGKPLHLPGLG